MIKYNVGQFKHTLHLLKPDEATRDELGGYNERTYTEVGTVRALQRDKSSTFRQVIGDYVTVNTCYFIVRDCRCAFPIGVEWRIKVEGQTYVINSVTLLDDTPPYFLELECTRIGGIG